jgi:FMN reductase
VTSTNVPASGSLLVPKLTVVGFSANISRPSKTGSFLERIAREAATAHLLSGSVFDIDDLGPPAARGPNQRDAKARKLVDVFVGPDVIGVGSPTYKGDCTGLFKHFFDLLAPASRRGKPVILAGTGGGERHFLIIEHLLRPLFGFFEAFVLPTAIYAPECAFADGTLADEAIRRRVSQPVFQEGRALGPSTTRRRRMTPASSLMKLAIRREFELELWRSGRDDGAPRSHVMNP